VKIWNNLDSGSATNDTDSVIFIRAEVTGTTGGKATIELSLQGSVSGVESVTGYSGQEGGGSGKSYSSEDAEAITDFSTQIT
jgi:hypothetical protein